MTQNPGCRPPAGSELYNTVSHEIFLKPGDQYTIFPHTLRWFQAGPEGSVVSEFSTKNTHDADIFTDARISVELKEALRDDTVPPNKALMADSNVGQYAR